MEVDIAAGAFLDLGSKIDGMRSSLDRLHDCKPIHGKSFASGIVDAAGDDLLLVCNTVPSVGRVWNLLSFHISGVDPNTPPTAGKYMVAIGNSTPQVTGAATHANTDFSEVIDRASASSINNLDVPFSRHVYWVHSHEQVYCWLMGITPVSQQMSFVVWYADYPVEAVEALSV